MEAVVNTQRPFVESLRRLYVQGRVTIEKLKEFVASGKITTAEYDYITS